MEKENTPPSDDLNGGGKPHLTPTDGKGWDGKLRVDRRPVLQNPEAISDPEYSDEEHVVPGEEISADEGMFHNMHFAIYSGAWLRSFLENRSAR
jgi:protein phosphatase 1 regulatory subunit 7